MAKPPLLECRDLRKRYGERTAVDGISFAIAPGETYGLLGPNGAGKTTTISMVCGLLRRDGGEVFVAGRPVDIGATEAKASIGYVPQDLAIYPDLTARENLQLLRPIAAPRRSRTRPACGRDPGPDRSGRPREGSRRQLLRRDEAPAQHRHRAPPQAGAPGARRTDRRRRSAEPECDPLERRGPRPRGDGGPLHDALHGGGGAAVRPDRDHRRGPDQGRGHPSRAGRAGRPEGPRRAGRERGRGAGDDGARGAGLRRGGDPRRRNGSSSSWTRRGTISRASSRRPRARARSSRASRSSSPTSRRSSST